MPVLILNGKEYGSSIPLSDIYREDGIYFNDEILAELGEAELQIHGSLRADAIILPNTPSDIPGAIWWE